MQILNHVSDKSDFFQIFSATLGKMMTVQTKLGEIIGNSDWNVDFDSGEISFGDKVYQIQLIGSESNLNSDWLWGYENINGFNSELIKLSKNVLKMGKEWDLKPFNTTKFEISDSLNGHILSIAACGVMDENLCYYGCRHDNGCVFVAITNAENLVFEPVCVNEFVKIANECIQRFDLNHKIFIKSFLDYNKTPYDETFRKGGFFRKAKNEIVAKFKENLTIEFDNMDRIINLKYKFNSES